MKTLFAKRIYFQDNYSCRGFLFSNVSLKYKRFKNNLPKGEFHNEK